MKKFLLLLAFVFMLSACKDNPCVDPNRNPEICPDGNPQMCEPYEGYYCP